MNGREEIIVEVFKEKETRTALSKFLNSKKSFSDKIDFIQDCIRRYMNESKAIFEFKTLYEKWRWSEDRKLAGDTIILHLGDGMSDYSQTVGNQSYSSFPKENVAAVIELFKISGTQFEINPEIRMPIVPQKKKKVPSRW